MYECVECGFESAKWMGFCPRCPGSDGLTAAAEPVDTTMLEPVALVGLEGDRHRPTGVGEVDRVLGGGLIPGASILLGGEPGVGKSTLLMQAAGAIAADGRRVVLATAEESRGQVAMRARRVGIDSRHVVVLADHRLEAVMAAAAELRPALLVVDSIQTVQTESAAGHAGGVGQVRECALQLVRFAKDHSVPVVLIGHVTKDGSIGGPKQLEHMVDVVLYLEGDPDRGLRMLRGLKNRFGRTQEAGLFEMGERGLRQVADPSQSLVGQWRGEASGTVVFPSVEGRRALLVEIQALVTPSSNPQPRRSVRGIEIARVHQLLAVLERHTALPFTRHEVYVGVAGGVRVREPGADLAVALALASSLTGRAIGHAAAYGEVSLTGEVRPVAHGEWRHREAERLGITHVLAPTEGTRHPVQAFLADAGVIDHRLAEVAV
jgi:DNA repair protein RadA/Sms